MTEPLDCIIVGAGPAGLTAAIYLARFDLAIRVVDDGASRCATIPLSRNHAGFPGGVSGRDLLRRMREQAAEFGGRVTDARVRSLSRRPDGIFEVRVGDEVATARTVLLATGVVNHRPPISEADHESALERGLLRYCPICDGYEVRDQTVGVIGTQSRGCNEALFVRMYTRSVTLVSPEAEHSLSDEERRSLEAVDIKIVDGPCGTLRLDGPRIVVPTAAGPMGFDTVYPALGSRIRSELAVDAGAEAGEDGCLMVDDHQRTSLEGLYAAGDVVKGLDQISHAMGEAGVAATTIRNALAATRSLAR